jgi:hypothetical protein
MASVEQCPLESQSSGLRYRVKTLLAKLIRTCGAMTTLGAQPAQPLVRLAPRLACSEARLRHQVASRNHNVCQHNLCRKDLRRRLSMTVAVCKRLVTASDGACTFSIEQAVDVLTAFHKAWNSSQSTCHPDSCITGSRPSTESPSPPIPGAAASVTEHRPLPAHAVSQVLQAPSSRFIISTLSEEVVQPTPHVAHVSKHICYGSRSHRSRSSSQQCSKASC